MEGVELKVEIVADAAEIAERVAKAQAKVDRLREQLAALEARIVPIEGLTIAPRLSYAGAFRDFVYDNTGNGTGFGTSQGGTVVHISATYDAAPGVQVFGHVLNAFQSRFEPVNGFQTPGAAGIVGIRLRM